MADELIPVEGGPLDGRKVSYEGHWLVVNFHNGWRFQRHIYLSNRKHRDDPRPSKYVHMGAAVHVTVMHDDVNPPINPPSDSMRPTRYPCDNCGKPIF